MSSLSNWSSSSINSLFNSGSSGSGNSAFNMLSDYSAIKNGSYGKLMKSYFGLDKTSNAGNSSKSSNSGSVVDKLIKEKMYPSVSKDVAEANTALSQGVSDMKSSVAKLQTASTYEDTQNGSTARSKVSSALKDFVTNYNSTVTASKNSTAVGMTSNVAAIMRSTDSNKDALAAIGITKNSDGTISFNESKFQTADLSKVQDLFSSDNIMSYGSTVSSRLKFAGSYSSSTSSASTVTDSTATKQATNASASGLKADAKSLASKDLYAKVKDADGNETDQYDVKNITAKAQSFVKNYNDMFDAAKSSSNSGVTSNLSYISSRTKDNESALAELGITIGNDGKLSIDTEKFQNSDMSKVQELFKNYGSSVATNASLVDYYMNTQAGAANGYTADAAYNVQAASSYTTIT